MQRGLWVKSQMGKKKKSKYTVRGNKTFTKTVSPTVLDGWESKSEEDKVVSIDKMVFLLSCGAKLEDVAKSLGISTNTLYNWRVKHKDVSDALSSGYIECGGRAFRELHKIAYNMDVDVSVRVNILNRLYDNSLKRYEALLLKEDGKKGEDSRVVIEFTGVGYEGCVDEDK